MNLQSNDITSIYKVLSQVTDPEIPVLTIEDLGVLRDVEWEDDKLVVTITPTYSGCPAMGMIEKEIHSTLKEAGFENVLVKTSLSPAWTTDWLSEAGRNKLEEYGIAPPLHASADKKILLGKNSRIRCPRCKSENTEMKSQFGSTACKALYVCKDCKEPFDYFKCL
jgi:ring-1,2-phenylacetyl-CoA epoxidase subunit PaaD